MNGEYIGNDYKMMYYMLGLLFDFHNSAGIISI